MNEREFSERDIETAFIENHWEYGSQIHETSAAALVAALDGANDIAATHTLFIRLFAEFAGSLETYAAWGWALRNRAEPGSFLAGYLGYSNRSVGDFYVVVRDYEGDLSDLLRLPPAERIVEITMERHRGAVIPPEEPPLPSADEYRGAMEANYARIKEAAVTYFREDRIVIDAYNKTKHGAPLVRLWEPDNPSAFEILIPVPADEEADEPPYRFASFHATPEEVTKYRTNVDAMTISIRELAAITRVVFEADLLY